MTHASLFSGIGGFDLAAQQAGYENVFQVEIDPWCCRVLEKNFPNVSQYKDITQFNATPYENKIDILTGGFPCQPFSIAGPRRGKRDNRYLWPQMLRIIKEIKPKFIIGENVPGIINLALDTVFTDLENIGYQTESFVIPACSQNAPHRRDRVWIIAYKNGVQNKCLRKSKTLQKSSQSVKTKDMVLSNTTGKRRPQCLITSINDKAFRNMWRTAKSRNYWQNKPSMGRVADGLSHRMDRIKGLGNAIVPQVAEQIFKAIKTLNNN